MRFLIKQRVFSWTDTYDIYDEHHKKKYVVRGELISLGHVLNVFDTNNKKVGEVREKLISFMPTFTVYERGQNLGPIHKKMTMFHPKYEFDSKDWSIEGDLVGWNYDIKHGRNRIAKISKQLLHWGDTYIIDVANPSDALTVLLLVVAIDAANCEERDPKHREQ